MSQDDSGSEHFSDFFSEASDDDGNNPETETTEVETRRPKNLEMRRNGCNRGFSSDACHMLGLVKGTCFSTTSQNANGNLVPLYVSYNIEAEGRKPWLLSQKNLELFDPSINELPSELLTRPLNVLIVINTEFHILCILQHIFLFHLFFLSFFFLFFSSCFFFSF